MADRKDAAVRIQAFPQQKLTGLPKDKDIELTMVPRQVMEFQGITPDDSAPRLTITVDSTGRSKLHYTPTNCVAGTEACLDGPGVHEIWVPAPQKDFAELTIQGFSTRAQVRIPQAIFDSSMPFKVLMGEFPDQPKVTATWPFPVDAGGGQPPGELDDFFIGMADEKGILKDSGLPYGKNDFDKLSKEQKGFLRSLVKEVVAAGGLLLDERNLISDFGFRGEFYLKPQNGKTYVIFKGYAGLRKFYKGTRYALDKNYARFSILTVKQGPMQAVKQAIPKATGGTAIGFLFMGLVNSWAWLSENPESRFLSDLIIEIGSDAAKAVVGGFIGAAVVGLFAMMFSVTVPVFAVIAGVAVIGILVGLGLDFLDGKLGVTEAVKKAGRKAEGGLKGLWDDYVESPFVTFVNRCEWEISRLYGIQR